MGRFVFGNVGLVSKLLVSLVGLVAVLGSSGTAVTTFQAIELLVVVLIAKIVGYKIDCIVRGETGLCMQ